MPVSKRKKIKTSLNVKVNPELSAKALADLAQELVAPIQAQLTNVKIDELKKQIGSDIGKIKIASMHGKLSGHIGHVAGGYECKLWEKACC